MEVDEHEKRTRASNSPQSEQNARRTQNAQFLARERAQWEDTQSGGMYASMQEFEDARRTSIPMDTRDIWDSWASEVDEDRNDIRLRFSGLHTQFGASLREIAEMQEYLRSLYDRTQTMQGQINSLGETQVATREEVSNAFDARNEWVSQRIQVYLASSKLELDVKLQENLQQFQNFWMNEKAELREQTLSAMTDRQGTGLFAEIDQVKNESILEIREETQRGVRVLQSEREGQASTLQQGSDAYFVNSVETRFGKIGSNLDQILPQVVKQEQQILYTHEKQK